MTGAEGHGERRRLCVLHAWHLFPSWGCCDYLVKIATLSTQTKLTMANDPLTGIDSWRKCQQCSLHPHWIRFHPPSPATHRHKYEHHHHVLTIWFIYFSDIMSEGYQLGGGGVGALSVTQWKCVSETPSPLLHGLNGERWYRPKHEITHRRLQGSLRLNIKA